MPEGLWVQEIGAQAVEVGKDLIALDQVDGSLLGVLGV